MRLISKFPWPKKGQNTVEPEPPAPSAVAGNQVTDQTLEKHRREIFTRGRRLIYPVHITKRKVVRNSIILVVALFIAGSVALGLSVYRYHNEGGLVYKITSVIPLPAAKINGHYVRYYEYLFHLRISSTFIANNDEPETSDNLNLPVDELRRRAFLKAKQDKLVELLAKQNNISVSDEDVEAQLAFLVTVSSGESRLNDIVKHDYGVEVGELKHAIYVQLLSRKLAPILSVSSHDKAQQVLQRAKNGEDFAALAKESSDDQQTAQTGGSLGIVTKSSNEIDPILVEAAFDLPVGGISDIVETNLGFHILKKISQTDPNNAEIAHIMINYEDMESLLQRELDKARVIDYIKL